MQAGKDIIAETSIAQEETDTGIKMDENGQTKLFQSMYADEKYNSLYDFVEAAQKDINSLKKAKKQIGNYRLSVPADVLVHDNKHALTPSEWVEIENNIDNIFIAKKTDEANSFSTNNYKVGMQTDKGEYYGLVIGINKKDNIVCTALKFNTKNSLEAFVDERGKKDKKKNLSMMPTSQPSASVSNNANSVASHSKGSNNIIPYIKENITPDTKLYQETDQTKTEAFKKWFGDSKVVDEDGKPLVVYHGTNNDFDTFIIDYPSQAMGTFKGAYFVDNLSEAKDYGDNIKAVYVKIENPFIGNPYEEYAKAKGLDYEKSFFDIKKEQVENWIKEMNFDGIIRPKKSQYNLSGMEVIPFSANQIKSVENQGTFDENNPNIYMQLKNTPKQPKIFKGAYDVSAKAIELFKDADYSTLPHELAHFWLDNMWGYYRSGKASEAYTNNFKGVLDWLEVKDGQINLTRNQQEKFARGYEAF